MPMQLNRKEFLGLVTRGAVAFGATALPWARLRAEPPGPSWRRSAPTWRPPRRGAPAGGRRGEQAPHPRHLRRDDLRDRSLPPGRAAHRARARAAGGSQSGRWPARRVLCGPIEAALANGVMAHADETDDSHGPSQSHPGSAVVPAALAAGEQFGVDRRAASARRRARLRRRSARDDGARRREVSQREPPQHAQHRRHVRRVGGRGLRRAPERAADALAARLRRAAGVRLRGVGARHRSHRERVRVRRHAGPQRRHRRAPRQPDWSGVDDVFSGEDNFFEANAPTANPAVLVERWASATK